MLFVLVTLSILAIAPDGGEPAAGITSAASPLLPRLCVPAGDEDASVRRCSGLVGSDVFLRGEERDRTISIGSPDGFFPAFPVPSAMSRTLSWRILGDRPLAGILRYGFPQLGGQAPAAVLTVIKAGSAERPGCLVGIVEEVGASAKAVAAAERIADTKAAGFRCGTDRPGLEGLPSDFARRVILPWLAAQKP